MKALELFRRQFISARLRASLGKITPKVQSGISRGGGDRSRRHCFIRSRLAAGA
jgi:hypothetical protein